MVKQIVVFLTTLAVVAFTQPTYAQHAENVPRIGFLSLTTNPMPQLGAFRKGLRELGYVEGKNLVIIYKSAERRPKRLSALAAELVALKVDLIVTYSTPGVRAAKQATKTIPIVMSVGSAVRRGFVKSLARPGGNVTGLSFIGDTLIRKRISLLKDTLPNISPLAILYHEATPKGAVRTAETTARSIGLKVQRYPVTKRDSLERTFDSMRAQRATALLVISSPIFLKKRKEFTELAARYQTPAIYGFKGFVVAGGLMSYSPSLTYMFRRLAVYVDKILKGAKPADLPVEQPTKFNLAINLKTAKALGITIPRAILLRADEVIE